MLERLSQLLSERTALVNGISTLVLLVGIILLRWIISKAIRKQDFATDVKRRFIVATRNVAFLVFLFFSAIIWASELRTAALSLAAIAAAIVISTKELILCLSGSILRGTSRAFGIGDRIEVKGLRGEVIDQSLLTTTILEVGPHRTSHQKTGRAIVMPNSLFLSEPVTNESFTEQFVFHTFTVPVESHRWKEASSVLLSAAKEHCEPHLEEARRHFRALGEEWGLDTPAPEPRISMELHEPKTVHLVVRIAAPAALRGRTEQAIISTFLQRFPSEPRLSGCEHANQRAAKTE